MVEVHKFPGLTEDLDHLEEMCVLDRNAAKLIFYTMVSEVIDSQHVAVLKMV
jgi:hypothetical protein